MSESNGSTVPSPYRMLRRALVGTWALGCAAIPTTIATASIYMEHETLRLQHEAISSIKNDGFKPLRTYTDVEGDAGSPHFADLQVEPGCSISEVQLHYQKQADNISNIGSYSITMYLNPRLIPDDNIGLHDSGYAITGNKVILDFDNKADFERNLLGTTPCQEFAAKLAYQQSFHAAS